MDLQLREKAAESPLTQTSHGGMVVQFAEFGGEGRKMFLGRGSGKMSLQLGHAGLRDCGHPPGELRLGLWVKA